MNADQIRTIFHKKSALRTQCGLCGPFSQHWISQVTDIAFTFDVFLPIEGEGTTDCLDHLEPQTGGSDLPRQPRLEEEEEDKGVTLLLFYVEMSRDDSQEDVILQLDDLRLFAPRELLKFLESSIALKSDEEEDSASEAAEEDLVST